MKKGEYPVPSELARLIANSIAGSRVTQSLWLVDITDLSICVTVLFARSVDPSVSGWYALDIFCLTPISL